MIKTKKFWYILLFGILYLIVAFSSFFHAVSFFGLANNSWMSIILAFAFEIGQAAVLFSLLTSEKDRSRIMPWVLMTMFTLVQVIGNIYSSYKYIINNSIEDLRYFKEPIFIWTSIPDNQATVIIVYLVGALLPIASLLLTSMITNYLSDESEKEQELKEEKHEVIIDNGKENKESEKKEILDSVEEQETTDSIGTSKEKEDITEEHSEIIDNGKEIKVEETIPEEIPENIQNEAKESVDKPEEIQEELPKSHFINLH